MMLYVDFNFAHVVFSLIMECTPRGHIVVSLCTCVWNDNVIQFFSIAHMLISTYAHIFSSCYVIIVSTKSPTLNHVHHSLLHGCSFKHSRFEMNLNQWMTVERYPFPNGVVSYSILTLKFSLYLTEKNQLSREEAKSPPIGRQAMNPTLHQEDYSTLLIYLFIY